LRQRWSGGAAASRGAAAACSRCSSAYKRQRCTNTQQLQVGKPARRVLRHLLQLAAACRATQQKRRVQRPVTAMMQHVDAELIMTLGF